MHNFLSGSDGYVNDFSERSGELKNGYHMLFVSSVHIGLFMLAWHGLAINVC